MVESYPIDGAALKALLKLNGYKATQVSIACGHSPAYLSVCINRQRMKPANAQVLESVTGIPLEAYAILPKGRSKPGGYAKPAKPAIMQTPSAVREPDPELLAEAIRRVLMDDKLLRALARALLCACLTSIRDSVAEGGDGR